MNPITKGEDRGIWNLVPGHSPSGIWRYHYFRYVWNICAIQHNMQNSCPHNDGIPSGTTSLSPCHLGKVGECTALG
ncbi:hypothetical protein FKM82_010134 [Ascaphus truei]